MPRIGSTYTLSTSKNDDPHVSATSTGTSNVQTVTVPSTCKGMYIACVTNGGYFTFDGTTPDSTNGIPIQDGLAPVFFPVGATSVKFVSDFAGNCVAHFMFLE